MRVTLFGNMVDKVWKSPSMDRYTHELEMGLKEKGVQVELVEPATPSALSFLPSQNRFRASRYVYYPFIAKGRQGDVNHITDHSFGQVAKDLDLNKTIITCHDLIPLHFEKDKFSIEMFKESVSYLTKVRFVLSDSEATKQDLIDILGVDEKKIKVVYLGRNESFKRVPETKIKELKSKYKISSKPLILHVGNNLEYKNINKMVDALNVVKSKGFDFEFIKVGPTIDKDMSFDYRHIPQIPEDDMASLYSSVDFLLYPSVMEGFGFPTLEAMSCETLVVVGKDTSLGEIAGESGIYVDGKDTNSIVEGVIRVLEMKQTEKDELTKIGLKRSSEFGWEKTVNQVLSVYKEIAGE